MRLCLLLALVFPLVSASNGTSTVNGTDANSTSSVLDDLVKTIPAFNITRVFKAMRHKKFAPKPSDIVCDEATRKKVFSAKRNMSSAVAMIGLLKLMGKTEGRLILREFEAHQEGQLILKQLYDKFPGGSDAVHKMIQEFAALGETDMKPYLEQAGIAMSDDGYRIVDNARKKRMAPNSGPVGSGYPQRYGNPYASVGSGVARAYSPGQNPQGSNMPPGLAGAAAYALGGAAQPGAQTNYNPFLLPSGLRPRIARPSSAILLSKIPKVTPKSDKKLVRFLKYLKYMQVETKNRVGMTVCDGEKQRCYLKLEQTTKWVNGDYQTDSWMDTGCVDKEVGLCEEFGVRCCDSSLCNRASSFDFEPSGRPQEVVDCYEFNKIFKSKLSYLKWMAAKTYKQNSITCDTRLGLTCYKESYSPDKQVVQFVGGCSEMKAACDQEDTVHCCNSELCNEPDGADFLMKPNEQVNELGVVKIPPQEKFNPDNSLMCLEYKFMLNNTDKKLTFERSQNAQHSEEWYYPSSVQHLTYTKCDGDCMRFVKNASYYVDIKGKLEKRLYTEISGGCESRASSRYHSDPTMILSNCHANSSFYLQSITSDMRMFCCNSSYFCNTFTTNNKFNGSLIVEDKAGKVEMPKPVQVPNAHWLKCYRYVLAFDITKANAKSFMGTWKGGERGYEEACDEGYMCFKERWITKDLKGIANYSVVTGKCAPKKRTHEECRVEGVKCCFTDLCNDLELADLGDMSEASDWTEDSGTTIVLPFFFIVLFTLLQ